MECHRSFSGTPGFQHAVTCVVKYLAGHFANGLFIFHQKYRSACRIPFRRRRVQLGVRNSFHTYFPTAIGMLQLPSSDSLLTTALTFPSSARAGASRNRDNTGNTFTSGQYQLAA